MSDHHLVFVPTKVHCRPSKEAAEKAVALLKEIAPEADDVSAEFFDEVQFQDPGDNWEGARCPVCNTELATDWFVDMLNERGENEFRDLAVNAPCCGAETSLDALTFVSPAAFGQFFLTAEQPRIDDVSDEQRAQLAECLGTDLTIIWQRI